MKVHRMLIFILTFTHCCSIFLLAGKRRKLAVGVFVLAIKGDHKIKSTNQLAINNPIEQR